MNQDRGMVLDRDYFLHDDLDESKIALNKRQGLLGSWEDALDKSVYSCLTGIVSLERTGTVHTCYNGFGSRLHRLFARCKNLVHCKKYSSSTLGFIYQS